MLALAAPAHADLASAPTGNQIAALAKRTQFNLQAAFSPGAGVRVTPALPSAQPLANGRVVALLRNQVALSQGLSPGQYHIYLARIRGTWRAFAESNGRLVAESAKVVLGPSGSSMADAMCFGWYTCHNGKCLCYGLVVRGTEF
jgi:hypothetical protein